MHARLAFVLGFVLAIAGCTCGEHAGEGAIRVVVFYEHFRPGCLEVSATEARPGGEAQSLRFERTALTGTKATIAVYPQEGWISALDLRVRSYEGACSGTPLEDVARGEPLSPMPGQVSEWVVNLAAMDEDGDGFAAQADGGSGGGSDCGDRNPAVHPGSTELCSGTNDLNCDGRPGCLDGTCLGKTCDDGQGCTTSDACLADGGCGGAPVVCGVATDQCRSSDGGCEPGLGCVYPVELAKPCDAGTGASASCRSDGTCAAGEANCTDGFDNDGDLRTDCADSDCLTQTCIDGIPCTLTDRCQSDGGCRGVLLSCSSPPAGQCWADAGFCDGGACVYRGVPTRTCTDNNACTVGDICRTDGVCDAGSSKSCGAPGVCELGPSSCNPANGACSFVVDAGAACNDNDVCSFNDRCQANATCLGSSYSCVGPLGECYDAGCHGDGGCYQVVRTGQSCSGSGSCASDGGCVPAGLFPYAPSNFDPADYSPSAAVTIDCPTAQFDSSGSGSFSGCWSQSPTLGLVDSGFGGTMVLAMSALTITDAGSLTLVGDRPVILAVYGAAHVAGGIFANSQTGGTTRTGPGADWPGCGLQRGGAGPNNGNSGGGGGGAGNYTAGADGGGGDSLDSLRGIGGVDGGWSREPLHGGCHGGSGGRGQGAAFERADGGAGGGAVQLSAATTLLVQGAVSASGAGGAPGAAAAENDEPGGGGGGSAGAVLLEASTLTLLSSCKLTANGGGGGGGARNTSAGGVGSDGTLYTVAAAPGGSGANGGGTGGAGGFGSTPPVAGSTGSRGGGGGGGAAGFIYLRSSTSCTVLTTTISPPPIRINCP
ncbi:MAG: MopE-related protein [Myxococcaceae bacterium]